MTPKHFYFSQRRPFPRWPFPRPGLVSAALWALLCGASSQAAADPPDPSAATFNIVDKKIQKAPTSFKFQSRISQAKMPVGNQQFTKVIVNLVRGGGEVLCTEELSDVMVRDSVLNMEIGRGFSCALDDIIAQNADLSFQICLNREENCLKAIPLSSVPYAVKSTFSHQSEQAYAADVAAQCHYAHRVTADTALLEGGHYDKSETSGIGVGYYDFQTPVGTLGREGSLAGQTSYGGYVQWTPMDELDSSLHICARETDDTNGVQTLTDLDVLELHATEVLAHGDLGVVGQVRAASDSWFDTNLSVAATTTTTELKVSETTFLNGDVRARYKEKESGFTVDSEGKTTFHGTVEFMQETEVPVPSGSISWSSFDHTDEADSLPNAVTALQSIPDCGINFLRWDGTSYSCGGGPQNQASGTWSSVGGGEGNEASNSYSSVAGGYRNAASGENSSVAGGYSNEASGFAANVAGGSNNKASGDASSVAGGTRNAASGYLSSVAGGVNNTAQGDGAVVGGGGYYADGNSTAQWGPNQALGAASTVSGGFRNASGDATNATKRFQTVGGGYSNTASGSSSSVAGGYSNTATGSSSSVAGGYSNTASGDASSVAGGYSNTATGSSSSVAGGYENTATGLSSSVAGGASNTASNSYSSVAGGRTNQATGSYSSVAGGRTNQATGIYSNVAGGSGNTATGANSFAAGTKANANGAGCFVWSDGTAETKCDSVAYDAKNPGGGWPVDVPQRFVARASGGFVFLTSDGTAGVKLAAAGGSWINLSDRNAKHDITPIDADDVLAKIAAMPVSTWRYTSQENSLHMGPMAQDFHAAFGLGTDEKGITTIDGIGVALAAAQGLARENERLKATAAGLGARVSELTERVSTLEGENRALALSQAAMLERLDRVELGRSGDAGRLGGFIVWPGIAAAGGFGALAFRRRRRASADGTKE